MKPPIRFTIAGQVYSARVTYNEDYVLYAIYRDIEYLCTIGLGEKDIWESIENIDQKLVRRFGLIIEKSLFNLPLDHQISRFNQ